MRSTSDLSQLVDRIVGRRVHALNSIAMAELRDELVRELTPMLRCTCPDHGDPLICMACEIEEDARPEWRRHDWPTSINGRWTARQLKHLLPIVADQTPPNHEIHILDITTQGDSVDWFIINVQPINPRNPQGLPYGPFAIPDADPRD